jgi:pyrroloquinoline-quinone synthase
MLAMNIVERIDSEIEKRSLLKHPFYQMWSEGKLTVDHLKGYSKEYFQLVKAVPVMVENIATNSPTVNPDIANNAAEEASHIEPWTRFAKSLGVSSDELSAYQGDERANVAVAAMKKLSRLSFEQSVAAMYAYEAELPKISRAKIDGLKKFYAMNSKDANEYFEIHEEADVRHAQVWRDLLLAMPEEKQNGAYHAAIESLQAQNHLLDSVMEKYIGTGC